MSLQQYKEGLIILSSCYTNPLQGMLEGALMNQILDWISMPHGYAGAKDRMLVPRTDKEGKRSYIFLQNDHEWREMEFSRMEDLRSSLVEGFKNPKTNSYQ